MQKFLLCFPQGKHEHANLANRCAELSTVQGTLSSLPKLLKQLMLCLWTKWERLSGSRVKHWNCSVRDPCSYSSRSDWCWL